MSQRSFFLVAVLLLLLAVGGVALGLVLLRQEPAWYTAAAVAPGSQRTADSLAFKNEFQAMINSISYETEPYVTFTDTQTNSFFEEDYLALHCDRMLSIETISQPRIAFEQDRIKIGFRYGRGLWSSIVSVELRVWLPRDEPNVVALELEGFHAGLLPISSQSLLEEIAQIGRKNGMDVDWYRHGTHPVALLRLQPDQPRPTFQLKTVQIKDHSIMIQWRTLDGGSVRPPEPTVKTAPATP